MATPMAVEHGSVTGDTRQSLTMTVNLRLAHPPRGSKKKCVQYIEARETLTQRRRSLLNDVPFVRNLFP